MKLIVNGETAQIQTSGGGGTGATIPSGGIIIWSSAADAVPDGWALCDGTNGTPDLRGKFVLGSSESHALGSTSGSEEVTLTVEQIPEHFHIIQGMLDGSYVTQNTGTYPVFPQNNKANSFCTSETGGSQSHQNMPPYYTLAYIMKL